MIVVAVLMISCQVSTLPMIRNDGAHSTISATQKAKKTARPAMCEAAPAKRSKNPTRLETSLGHQYWVIVIRHVCRSFRSVLQGMFPWVAWPERQ
jgi:hypothetical protein